MIGFYAAGAMGAAAGGGGSDDFSSDTRSLYTMTQDSGAPTAAIASGVLTLTSPAACQSSFTRTGTSVLDGWVEADIDTAQDSGLLFRFLDQSNFYLLAISDDSGSNPSSNLQLYRRVSGAFTAMGTYNTAWSRGSARTIRLEAVGSSIKAYIGGVEVISATSAHIATAGKIGVRGNGPPGGTNNNKFNALRWS